MVPDDGPAACSETILNINPLKERYSLKEKGIKSKERLRPLSGRRQFLLTASSRLTLPEKCSGSLYRTAADILFPIGQLLDFIKKMYISVGD